MTVCEKCFFHLSVFRFPFSTYGNGSALFHGLREDVFYFSYSVLFHKKMSLPVAHSFEPKLNFWSNVLKVLIYTPVKDRCYNSKGSKIKDTENFLIKHSTSLNPPFAEYKLSTLVDHFTVIINMAIELAREYEVNAEAQFSVLSPEYKNRVPYDFIRNETNDLTATWLNEDYYKNAILYPSVSLKAGPDFLKTLFKFNAKQKQNMDKANDVDGGRVVARYEARLLFLMVHVGFGELNTPAETLSGKVSGVAEQKMQAAAEQKLKDDLTQDFANHFLEDEAGDDEEDEANITLFSGKKRKMSLKSLTSEEKKLRKEKRKEAAQLAAQKTLQADPIDNFLKTMMDPAEIERREKREDQRQAQQQQMQMQMLHAMISSSNYQQQQSVSSSSSSLSNSSNYNPLPISQHYSSPCYCDCGKVQEQTHAFCHGCGRKNAFH